jgi:hypothetical protein
VARIATVAEQTLSRMEKRVLSDRRVQKQPAPVIIEE